MMLCRSLGTQALLGHIRLYGIKLKKPTKISGGWNPKKLVDTERELPEKCWSAENFVKNEGYVQL